MVNDSIEKQLAAIVIGALAFLWISGKFFSVSIA